MSSKEKSNTKSPTEMQLLSDARIFAQHIVIAIDCLDQSCAMDKIFTNEKHSAEYKAAPHFYRTAYHAMRFRFELEVSKLFDQKSRSFDSFKNDLSNCRLISQQEEATFKAAYVSTKNDINTIRNRRNKIHAHSDADCFNDPDLFSEGHPFNPEVIRKLLLSMLYICNAVVFRCTENGIAQLYGIGNSDDFVRLFGYNTTFDKQNDELLRDWGLNHDQL